MKPEQPLPSTAIHTISYERDTRNLRVVLESGWYYLYRNVPAATFAALAGSFARDEFYRRFIRGHFQHVRYPPAITDPARLLRTPGDHELRR